MDVPVWIPVGIVVSWLTALVGMVIAVGAARSASWCTDSAKYRKLTGITWLGTGMIGLGLVCMCGFAMMVFKYAH